MKRLSENIDTTQWGRIIKTEQPFSEANVKTERSGISES